MTGGAIPGGASLPKTTGPCSPLLTMTTKKTESPTETPTKQRSPIKTASLALLGIVGVAHIGVLGHLLKYCATSVSSNQFP
jgi:hypothetical protein